MNRNSVIALAFMMGVAITSAAFAARPSGERVVIKTDQSSGVIRFTVDEKTIVSIDAQGIHVSGNVDYAGALTDTNGVAEGR